MKTYTIDNRRDEIRSNITAFTKAAYTRDELLPELLKLQDDAVRETFNSEHADLAGLKLWDIGKHMEQLSQDKFGTVTDEVIQLNKASLKVCNLIKAEFSGRKGEFKAFRKLDDLRVPNYILKNVELTEADFRSELDAVVFTSKAVFIVEVKNTAKDIFISENGVYYRMSRYMRRDCCIAGKMDAKEKLLRNALAKNGINDVNVERIVVFTNENIEVQNKYDGINISFLSYLPVFIDGYKGEDLYNDVEMQTMQRIVDDARCNEAYPVPDEVIEFKETFTTALASLEIEVTEEVVPEENYPQSRRINFWNAVEKLANSPYAKEVGYAVAEFAIIAIASKIVKRVA